MTLTRPEHAMPNPAHSTLVPLFTGFLLLLLAFRLRRVRSERKGGLTKLVQASLLILSTACVLFSLLEAGWYFFYAASDNNNRTLASKRWFEKYWKPVNGLEFRDVEHQGADYSDKKVLFVLGDSFTAGQGIEDPNDRYPDILRSALGNEWAVINIARCGWNTFNEVGAINGVARQYRVKPDLVILAYFVNDIMDFRYVQGLKTSLKFKTSLGDSPPKIIRWMRDRSYFLNFLYWSVFRMSRMEAFAESHWETVRQAYKNEDIWKRHEKDLSSLVTRCKGFGAHLIVLVFPHLADVENTKALTAKVAGYFRSRGVAVIDMAPRLEGRDWRELTVSRLDGHPNETVHREVADLLAAEIGKSLPPADEKD